MIEEPVVRAHPEHVDLDIGGEFGALVIHADPELHDLKIEICRSGEEDRKREHQHILANNAVRARDVLIAGARAASPPRLRLA